MRVIISGVEKTQLVVPGSLSFGSQVGARSNGNFILRGDITQEPKSGQDVVFKQGETIVFGGLIARVKMVELNTNTDKLEFVVTVCDYSRYAERRTIANTFTNQTQGEIVRHLVQTKLAVFGVVNGRIDDGALINKVNYNYMKVGAALTELAQLNGKIWWIDYEKKLHFVDRTEFKASFDLTPATPYYRKLSLVNEDATYRNVQTVRAGRGITDPRTEQFVGDGTRKTFTVSFPIANILSMSVNSSPVTFGKKLAGLGEDFVWEVDSSEITQSEANNPLTSFYVLEVVYEGFYPVVVQVADDDEIAARTTIENVTSAVYEELVDDESIGSHVDALNRATTLLQAYGKVQKEISYDTFRPGLSAGMLQNVEIPALGLDEPFLITAIKVDEVNDNLLNYQITAVDGKDVGGWVDFFRKVAGTSRNFLIRGNELFVIFTRFNDSFSISAALAITESSGYPEVGTGEVGSAFVYT